MSTAAAHGSPRTSVLLCGLVVGLVAMVATFAVRPFGAPVAAASWCSVLGGLMLASIPGRTRPFGLGLAIGGVAPPLLLFLWLWLAWSAAALGGSVS